jgi:hypothetical protein
MSLENSTPVPSSESVFAEAFAAATGTNTPESESVDLQDPASAVSGQEAGETDEGNISATETNNEELSENEETPAGLSENIGEVVVKGKDGKRRNIKVDYSNKDQINKYVQKAANAVRLQSERDALQAQISKQADTVSAMDNLQEIVDTGGFEGLIDHLNAENGGFEAWMSQKINRHEQRLNASEVELAKLDAQERADALQRRLDRIEQQQLDQSERVSAETARAEQDRLASEINPIFFKHTFDGKLGDSVAEQRQNKVMFREVSETLDQLAEEGVKISPAVIEREFRNYTRPFLKSVNKKVRQNTKKVIDNKKAEATTHAQQQVRKGADKGLQNSSGHWVKDLTGDWLTGKLGRR